MPISQSHEAERDLKEIRAKMEAMSHSGLFNRIPDVHAAINGAIAGALADIEFDRLCELSK